MSAAAIFMILTIAWFITVIVIFFLETPKQLRRIADFLEREERRKQR